MTASKTLISAVLLSAVATSLAFAGAPQLAFHVLYEFNGSPGTPASLSEASPGLFFGSTVNTGGLGGTVFSLNRGADFKIIDQFAGGYQTVAVVAAQNGALFGLNVYSTNGLFFSLNRNGAGFQSFPPVPDSTLTDFPVSAPNGTFYYVGGPAVNAASIFTVSPQGVVTPVHAFTATEGQPTYFSNLLRAIDGTIYGMNEDQTSAWIYKLTPQGQFTKLTTFPVGTTGEAVPLVLAPDGTIYGTLSYSGPSQQGSIYKLTPDGTMTTLVNFPYQSMLQPGSLMMASDGNLYGITHQIPSYIFRYDLTAGKLERLYQMSNDDGRCVCRVLEGSDGKFYGVSPYGGVFGFGTVFTFDAGLAPPPPSISLLRPAAGSVGTKVLLWGNNLLGATSVSFNGTAGTSVQSTSVQSVYVDVPVGATTGPVTVTTPNGSFTTTESFTVQ